MDLSNLKPAKGSKQSDNFRRGRGHGSGNGKTAGKGHKGQKARSGATRPGFEGGQMPLYRRIPKRGFTNRNSKEIIAINLDRLEVFDNDSVVTIEELLERRIIRKTGDGVKILGNGDLTKKLTVQVNAFSAGAKEKSGVSPVKYMAEDAARLEKAGCGAIVIPCNTSHIYYDKIADRVSIQVVNLIKEVAAEGNLCGMRRIGIMCTEGTRVSRLYDVAAERNFMQCVYPSEIGQKYVNSLIYDDVKAGRKPVRKKIIDVFDELLSRGCDGIVLGCTELSVAYRHCGTSQEEQD